MKGADGLNFSKGEELYGLSLEDSARTTMHERANLIGKSTALRDIAINYEVETFSLSPLKIGSSSIQDRMWSHVSNGFGSGCLLPYNPHNVSKKYALPSINATCSGYCIKNCNVDWDSNAIYPKNLSPLAKGSVSGSNGLVFPQDNIYSSVTDISVSEIQFHERKDDLMYYDWPDNGNFEDIDKMFSCDFEGQKHMGAADELSWFSASSENFYDSGVTFQFGMQSTCTEMGMLNNTMELLDGHANHISECKTSGIYGDVLSANVCQASVELGEPKSNEQVGSSVPIHETPSRIQESDKFQSNSLTHSPCSDSFHDASLCVRYKKTMPCQLPRSPTIHEGSVEEIHQEQKPCSSVIIENSNKQDNKASRASVLRKNACHMETGIKTGQESKTSDHSKSKDFSEWIEYSSMKTTVSGNKMHQDSFKLLHNSLDQLDVRTKLCIRDGLYRLARSAKQRHCFSHENRGSTENKFKRRAQCTVSSDFTEIDAETGTNPVDRSIAHLLFHKPLEHSSLQSHVTNHLMLAKGAD